MQGLFFLFFTVLSRFLGCVCIQICSLHRKDVEGALQSYPDIISLIRDRAQILWSKHNEENKRILKAPKQGKVQKMKMSVVPAKTTSTIMTEMLIESTEGADRRKESIEEESTFISQLEVLDIFLGAVLPIH